MLARLFLVLIVCVLLPTSLVCAQPGTARIDEAAVLSPDNQLAKQIAEGLQGLRPETPNFVEVCRGLEAAIRAGATKPTLDEMQGTIKQNVVNSLKETNPTALAKWVQGYQKLVATVEEGLMGNTDASIWRRKYLIGADALKVAADSAAEPARPANPVANANLEGTEIAEEVEEVLLRTTRLGFLHGQRVSQNGTRADSSD